MMIGLKRFNSLTLEQYYRGIHYLVELAEVKQIAILEDM